MPEINSDSVEVAFLTTIFWNRKESYVEQIINSFPNKILYKTENQILFSVIKRIKPDETNLINVCLQVKKQIPDWKVVETLDFANASLASLPSYVSYLKSLFFRRRSYELGEQIKQASLNDDNFSIFSSAKAVGKMYDVLTRRNGDKDFFQEALKDRKDLFIPSVFKKFNQQIGGFSRREISSIGGKSGHQKTAFVLFNATESIKDALVERIHYISIEHPGDIIAARILAKDLDIPYKSILDGTAVFNRLEAYEYLKKTYNNKLIITDDAVTLRQVIDASNSVKADQHIVDHSQEIHYVNNDMFGGISELLLELKQVARKQNANVLLLSQVVDKEIYNRFERASFNTSEIPYGQLIPKSHDFYNSSRIKQESRQLLVIYWLYQDLFELEALNGREDSFNEIKIVCYKSTYSGTTKLTSKIKPETGYFTL